MVSSWVQPVSFLTMHHTVSSLSLSLSSPKETLLNMRHKNPLNVFEQSHGLPEPCSVSTINICAHVSAVQLCGGRVTVSVSVWKCSHFVSTLDPLWTFSLVSHLYCSLFDISVVNLIILRGQYIFIDIRTVHRLLLLQQISTLVFIAVNNYEIKKSYDKVLLEHVKHTVQQSSNSQYGQQLQKWIIHICIEQNLDWQQHVSLSLISTALLQL